MGNGSPLARPGGKTVNCKRTAGRRSLNQTSALIFYKNFFLLIFYAYALTSVLSVLYLNKIFTYRRKKKKYAP
jgi:hypothetical protein